MIPKLTRFGDEAGSPPPSGGLAGVSLQLCWKCGERPATMMKYGFPVCAVCAEDPDFDPEEMEDRVIDAFEQSHVR